MAGVAFLVGCPDRVCALALVSSKRPGFHIIGIPMLKTAGLVPLNQ